MADLGREIGPQHAPGPERPNQSADRSRAAWIDRFILAVSEGETNVLSNKERS
jgi:hypothetical protein